MIKIRKSVSYMEQTHAIVFTKAYLDVQNRLKLLKMTQTTNDQGKADKKKAKINKKKSAIPRRKRRYSDISALDEDDSSPSEWYRVRRPRGRGVKRRRRERSPSVVYGPPPLPGSEDWKLLQRFPNLRPDPAWRDFLIAQRRHLKAQRERRRWLLRRTRREVGTRKRRRVAMVGRDGASRGPPLGIQFVDQRKDVELNADLKGCKINVMLGDGNCGFRAIALHRHSDVNAHHRVREDMAVRLDNNREPYLRAIQVDAPDMTATGLSASLRVPLAQQGAGLETVRSDRWLSSTLHFQLLADTYNIYVVSIAKDGGAISVVAPTSVTQRHPKNTIFAVRRAIMKVPPRKLLCLLFSQTKQGNILGHFDHISLADQQSGQRLRQVIAAKGCFSPSLVSFSDSQSILRSSLY